MSCYVCLLPNDNNHCMFVENGFLIDDFGNYSNAKYHDELYVDSVLLALDCALNISENDTSLASN